MPEQDEVTRLLIDWSQGDTKALDKLTPLVYGELEGLASRLLILERESTKLTLSPTELVQEAFLRLIGQRKISWQSRAHFFAIAARLMRRVLVDHARRRGRLKRRAPSEARSDDLRPQNDLLELDDALRRLSDFDQRQAQVIELRFFGGLTVDETAEVVGISASTVKRETRLARAWLSNKLGGQERPSQYDPPWPPPDEDD